MTVDGEQVHPVQNASHADQQIRALEREIASSTHILTATHHEMNREVTMVGFALDDLIDAIDAGESADELDLSELRSAYARLEEGRDHVAALAALGTSVHTTGSHTVAADELKVLTNTDMVVTPISRHPLIGVNRLLLRALVKNAARNAESHGRATEFIITTDEHRLVLADNGLGCTQAEIESAFRTGTRVNGDGAGAGLSLMRRVAEAHSASIEFVASPQNGVEVTIEFAEVPINLRATDAGTPKPAKAAARESALR